jgi:hypothetical protein
MKVQILVGRAFNRDRNKTSQKQHYQMHLYYSVEVEDLNRDSQ